MILSAQELEKLKAHLQKPKKYFEAMDKDHFAEIISQLLNKYHRPDDPDFAQDCRLAIWKALPRLTAVPHFRGIIYRICQCTIIDALRSHYRQPKATSIDAPHDDCTITDIIADEDRHSTADVMEVVSMTDLSPLEKKCFDGQIVKGLSRKETAKKIGTKPKAVANAIARVRQKMIPLLTSHGFYEQAKPRKKAKVKV